MNKSAEILEAIRAITRKHPHLRIGQIIANATPDRFRNDPYYVSDAELLEALDRMVELCGA